MGHHVEGWVDRLHLAFLLQLGVQLAQGLVYSWVYIWVYQDGPAGWKDQPFYCSWVYCSTAMLYKLISLCSLESLF